MKGEVMSHSDEDFVHGDSEGETLGQELSRLEQVLGNDADQRVVEIDPGDGYDW
jgi:hypothetical protein